MRWKAGKIESLQLHAKSDSAIRSDSTAGASCFAGQKLRNLKVGNCSSEWDNRLKGSVV